MLAPYSLIVTTSLKPDTELIRQAVAVAAELKAVYIPRPAGTLLKLADHAEADRLLVVEHSRFALWDRDSDVSYAYHPNLLPVRAHGLSGDGHDLFIDAMALEPGMTVLDGTLGFGTEATLAAWAVGPLGQVTGLECDAALAAVTRDGMFRFPLPQPAFREAMRRVQVVTADVRDFLRAAPSASVDVVYLDPFFPEHLPRSSASLSPLALFGCPDPLGRQTVTDALRVSRQRVVVKRPKESPLPDDWGATSLVSTRKSRVIYHVWRANLGANEVQ